MLTHVAVKIGCTCAAKEIPTPHAQLPALHVEPLEHGRSHPPQWRGSVAGSTQVEPHTTSGLEHPHAPAEHASPGSHGMLQPPQCWLLVCVSTHDPLQSVVPAGQPVREQAPAAHTSPARHGRSQPPQWRASLDVSAQSVPHAVSAPMQRHAAAPQLWPAPHATPHAPQFCGSDRVSRQLAPQSSVPGGHCGPASIGPASKGLGPAGGTSGVHAPRANASNGAQLRTATSGLIGSSVPRLPFRGPGNSPTGSRTVRW
jgi:hypothetical protein